MGAMYRLKAYFGMVPAEELVEYTDEPPARPMAGRRGARDDRWAEDRWADERRGDRYPEDRYGDSYGDSYDDRYEYPDDPMRDDRSRSDRDRRTSGAPVRVMAGPDRGEREPVLRSVSGLAGGSGSATPAVRGALAVDTDAVLEPSRSILSEPVPQSVPEQRVRGAAALARITTLQPRSYKEARTIGERYRDGQPVIMNLTELDAADAKRLVDFAAGLAFALRGSIDKVTNRVFLLTPADVEVSADDARRLAERSVGPRVENDRGLFRQD